MFTEALILFSRVSFYGVVSSGIFNFGGVGGNA